VQGGEERPLGFELEDFMLAPDSGELEAVEFTGEFL
jgi:hypothetical protein